MTVSTNPSFPVEDKIPISYVPHLLYLATYVGMCVIGYYLEPSSSGHGTHQQLGLPPCAFYTWTGIPCPSCGLTTAVSFLMHGQVGLSLKAQPFGAILFLLMTVLLFRIALMAWKKKAVSEALEFPWYDQVQVGLIAVFLLSWFYKIYTEVGIGK